MPDAHLAGRGDREVLAYPDHATELEDEDWAVGPDAEAEDGSEPSPTEVRIARALVSEPEQALPVVGVAGASGKAATAAFLRAIFRAEGRIVGSVGSASWFDGESIRPLGPKRPSAIKLAAILAEMARQGCDSTVLEVDQAAIDDRTVDAVSLAAVVVTGLGNTDRAATRRSQARLIRRVEAGGSVIIDADDPEADVLGAVNLTARRVTYGIANPGYTAHAATVVAAIDRVDLGSSRFFLRGFDRDVVVTLKVGGGQAIVRQAVAAAAVAWSLGIAADTVVRGLESVARIPGRFEPVRAGQAFEVRVDQAQTAGDLARVLAHLRAITPGRVICVVGAEGSAVGTPPNPARSLDHAALGEAAEAGADLVILTTNNPRDDDPNAILDAILAGMIRPGQVRVEIDRPSAIAFALAYAGPGDGVLIAGKGAHNYQICGDQITAYDDSAVADHILHNQRLVVARISA